MGIRNGKRKDKNNRSVDVEEYARIQEIIARKEAEAQRKMQEDRQEFRNRIRYDAKQEEQQIIEQPKNQTTTKIETEKDEVDIEIKEATRAKFENYCKRRIAEENQEKRRVDLLKVIEKLQEQEDDEIEF